MNENLAPWEEKDFSDQDFDADVDQNRSFADNASGDFDSLKSDEAIPPEKAPLIDEIAIEFVGFWNRLVSQTNWEKGKVIHTWRQKLIEAGLPRNVYSDDSIAKRIGNVSGQHVGRLRRVFEQFGDRELLPSLYWSHYQAALDWEDSQDWLQKASNEGLSVASMRIARWEKYGAPPERKPKEADVVLAEPDEDVNPFNDSNVEFVDVVDPDDSKNSSAEQDRKASQENGDSSSSKEKKSKENVSKTETEPPASGENLDSFRGDDEEWRGTGQKTGDVLNSMNELTALPDDLANAFESLKIAVLNHKLTRWADVESKLVLNYLAAVKAIVLSEDS